MQTNNDVTGRKERHINLSNAQCLSTNVSNYETKHEVEHKKQGRNIETGITPKKGYLELSMGRDIHLMDIPHYLNFYLVGRFCGKELGKVTLSKWMETNW